MNLVVIGAQWGDEGKGKIVDYLASDASLVIRFSGGANAGHTIVHKDKTYKLHQVPSGIVYSGKKVLLGSGMVIDVEKFFEELAILENQGLDTKGRVFISDRAHIVLPRYRELDKEIDKKRRHPIGTTGRGIGVAYSLRSSRDGMRIADMFDEKRLALFEESDREFIAQYAPKLKEMVVDVVDYVQDYKGESVLLEGAQGVLLDLDCGTYPFVSSGTSASGGAGMGSGFGPRDLDRCYGVFKAYQTRVGNGPFPTEYHDGDGGTGALIREIGGEYGVTTGRPRRCGYLDLVALKFSCRVNSLDALVMTHLDVYDSFDEIEVCTGYEINGKETDVFPAKVSDLESVKPIIKSFDGWKESIQDCKSHDELPVKAKEYLTFIEEYTGTPIDIISVGPDRTQTFYRKEPWTK